MASKNNIQFPVQPIAVETKYLNATTLQTMKHFPKDMAYIETDVNKLNNQMLVHYFEKEWAIYQ